MPIQRPYKFSDYISEYDLEDLKRLIKAGKDAEAISRYCSKLPKTVAAQYAKLMSETLMKSAERIYTEKQLLAAEQEIAIRTISTRSFLSDSFNTFVGKAIAPNLFKVNKLTISNLKGVLLTTCNAEYEGLISGAMSGTQANVLETVRKWQRELITRSQAFRFSKLPEDVIEYEKQHFKEMLKKKYPQQFDAIQRGQILRSRPLKNGKYKYFELDEYAEMSVTKTLQNLEANTVETAAQIFDVPVVEYYLRDKRHTDKERDICQHILTKNLIDGKALLALDQKTAATLGIMTLQEARAQGAMDFGCRHNIKQVDSQFRKKLQKALFANELSFSEEEE